ncbi:MAG TPA: alpha/beta hydrolase [Solirubrobacteraceae bacterium]|nr:alpha/beta hydrolase [Solirubrobacteraceae bacterium]
MAWSPEPPFDMPPARTVRVPGRGEFFLRDTGRDGPVVMLLHGWMASADLNWCGAYGDLFQAGYRVLAIDHRGHGRGLRPLERFRLADCAHDAAAVLAQLDLAPALVVGYSMGGAIGQLLARDHPDVVSGLVLSGTAQHWQDPQTRRVWRAMALLGMTLALAPRASWRWGFKRVGLPNNQETAWLHSEMMRHSASDLAEAGRELGRFDSRPWLGSVEVPVAVVITTRDDAVPVPKQRELAAASSARVFEAPIRHLGIVAQASEYNPALLAALESLREGANRPAEAA